MQVAKIGSNAVVFDDYEGIGVPLLLAYVYGVVPISLCRSGGCGVSTTDTGGVRIDFDESDVPAETVITPFTGKDHTYLCLFLNACCYWFVVCFAFCLCFLSRTFINWPQSVSVILAVITL